MHHNLPLPRRLGHHPLIRPDIAAVATPELQPDLLQRLSGPEASLQRLAVDTTAAAASGAQCPQHIPVRHGLKGRRPVKDITAIIVRPKIDPAPVFHVLLLF